MQETLSYTHDKFTFAVANDRYYSVAGVWAKVDGNQITVGVSDFFQQHNGDVAFADVTDVGATVTAGEDFANIETIKLDMDLPSPVSGQIAAVNEALALEAELINQDPYGAGWLAIIEAVDWTADRQALMTPDQYLEQVKIQAQAETG